MLLGIFCLQHGVLQHIDTVSQCWHQLLQVGKSVDKQLSAMSGQRLAAFGCGDEDSGQMQEQFQAWAQAILEAQSKQTGTDAFVEPLEPIITPEVS